MEPGVLQQIAPPALRHLLPDFLAAQVRGGDRERIAAFIAGWSDDDFVSLLEGLRLLGKENRVYPAMPRCRELARAWMRDVIVPTVSGTEHVAAAMARGRTVIVTNHLSYLDATATDVMLTWTGHTELADRIAYLAGPKVYQELFRLVAAASIHTLPVPQSAQLGHTEQLTARELARRAICSMEAGQGALEQGMALLFYPEGSRTRTGRMEPFLQATRRYLRAAEFLVPAAIVGTDQVMPLDGSALHPGPVSLTFAPPIPLSDEGLDEDPRASSRSGRDALMHAHEAIAALLPEGNRPVSGAPSLH